MGNHLIGGKFKSDKYPTCPPGKVPLSVSDVTAQDLLWEYAQRRRSVDAEFSDDLEAALRLAGYIPPPLVVDQEIELQAELCANPCIRCSHRHVHDDERGRCFSGDTARTDDNGCDCPYPHGITRW